MLSINTNLSSIITQNSMKQSTNKLNEAIERMTTGYKINHAKDNAANYSISTNMTTKIGAYDVAADNVAMGMDLVITASDTINQMQDQATRIRALVTQVRNGTYGAQSLSAIQSEVNARLAEIVRLHKTTEYNGISLFNKSKYSIASYLPQAGNSGFIDETGEFTNNVVAKTRNNGFIENPVSKTQAQVEALDSIDDFVPGAVGEYKIMSADDLAKLADIVNNASNDTSSATFYLGADIDLKEWHEENGDWVPIGNYSANSKYVFKGYFDGNGHVIKNLTIEDNTKNYQGLFGRIDGATIKNLALESGSINGNSSIGFLVGYSCNISTIANCFTTGNVTGQGDHIGGLVGYNHTNSTITNCYTTGNVVGQGSYTGGLVGVSYQSSISNSYATGNINGQGNSIGGLVGYNHTNSTITNCYTTGNVVGQGNYTGGLVGTSYQSSISNSYATGNINGQGHSIGGLVGYNYTNSTISNCYATGDVNGGSNSVGGLVGANTATIITNCYATGNVVGEGHSIGGIVGNNSSNSILTDCYATGNVLGKGVYTGGLIGYNSAGKVSNCYASGNVIGQGKLVGGLIGIISALDSSNEINKCAFYGSVDSTAVHSGSLIGGIRNTSDDVNYGTVIITNCEVMPSEENAIGAVLKANWSANSNYDMTPWLDEIMDVKIYDISTNLQVGVYGDNFSQINFDTNFELNISSIGADITNDSALKMIDDFINLLSKKSTMLGSISNRLESVLDEIVIQQDNLVSARSTLRDADMAEVSSQYIQQQILQEASATLMATTNQSPAIAIQLI